MIYKICYHVCEWAARKNEADDSLPIAHLLAPTVLWCYALYPNEREETHVGVSSLRQESSIWTSYYWWVSAAHTFNTSDPQPLLFMHEYMLSKLKECIFLDCSWRFWAVVWIVMRFSLRKMAAGLLWDPSGWSRRCQPHQTALTVCSQNKVLFQ